MADLTPVPGWDSVFQLETTTPVLGGPGGPSNAQAQALLNRTEALRGVRMTPQTASGATVTFSGIPVWATEIVCNFTNLSTTGASRPIIQLGNPSFITSGYDARSMYFTVSGAGGITLAIGFPLPGTAATDSRAGTFRFYKTSGDVWVGDCTCIVSNTALGLAAGRVTVPGHLSALRFAVELGPEIYDSGNISVMYR